MCTHIYIHTYIHMSQHVYNYDDYEIYIHIYGWHGVIPVLHINMHISVLTARSSKAKQLASALSKWGVKIEDLLGMVSPKLGIPLKGLQGYIYISIWNIYIYRYIYIGGIQVHVGIQRNYHL